MACSHIPLSGGDLDRVHHPAFIARIEENAGARAEVFQDDGVYRDRLSRMDPKEGDRRLQLKLAKAISRFEVSDRFRVDTYARLPRETPWVNTVSPAAVASALESFLVEEVPANPPDYQLLKPLGADAIVEFVVQRYGMRSKDGHGGAFIKGFARMFFLDGGEIWRSTFDVDQVREGEAQLDPFAVGKHPELFRSAMQHAIDVVCEDLARELQPASRRGGPPLAPGSDELNATPDDVHKAGTEGAPRAPHDDELPPPAEGQSEIRMKESGSTRPERTHPTAPGLQDPNGSPNQE